MNMSLINHEKADFARLDSTIVADEEIKAISPVENDFGPAVQSSSSDSEDNKTVVTFRPTAESESAIRSEPIKPEQKTERPKTDTNKTQSKPVKVEPSKAALKEIPVKPSTKKVDSKSKIESTQNEKPIKIEPSKSTKKDTVVKHKVDLKTETQEKMNSKAKAERKISEKKKPAKSLQAKEPDIKPVSSIKQKPNKSVKGSKTKPTTKTTPEKKVSKSEPNKQAPVAKKTETKSTVGTFLGNFFGMSKSVKETSKSPVIKNTTPKKPNPPKPSLMELARKPTIVDEKYKVKVYC